MNTTSIIDFKQRIQVVLENAHIARNEDIKSVMASYNVSNTKLDLLNGLYTYINNTQTTIIISGITMNV